MEKSQACFISTYIEAKPIFYFQSKKSAIHYNGFKRLRNLYEEIDSCLDLFHSSKLAMEQSSWEHKVLSQYHGKVSSDRKLDMKLAILIRVLISLLYFEFESIVPKLKTKLAIQNSMQPFE